MKEGLKDGMLICAWCLILLFLKAGCVEPSKKTEPTASTEYKVIKKDKYYTITNYEDKLKWEEDEAESAYHMCSLLKRTAERRKRNRK